MGVAALRHPFIRPLQANADRRVSEEEWIDIHWRDQLGVDAGVIVACDLGIIAGQGLVAGFLQQLVFWTGKHICPSALSRS